jgi:hypothetical protein
MTTDEYLIKMKSAGIKDSIIAGKLGMTENEVANRWKALLEAAQAGVPCGYLALCTQFSELCEKYRLLGECLKITAAALSDRASSEDVRGMIRDDPDQTIYNLINTFIVLRPFTPVTSEDSIQKSIEQN